MYIYLSLAESEAFAFSKSKSENAGSVWKRQKSNIKYAKSILLWNKIIISNAGFPVF